MAHAHDQNAAALNALGRLLVLLLAVLAASCGTAGRGLDQTFDTPEALAGAVLDGLARRDHPYLESLALSEEEFADVVWPELPASRPERNLPRDYVWRDLRQKSRSQLSVTLSEHGGRRYSVVAVKTQGERTRYASFEVARETQLTVRDGQGATRELRLFGAILERHGRYKVFSYVVD